MIRVNGRAPCKFDGRDRPLAIVAPDRDSQTVMLVKPNVLHRPGFAVSEDHGLADKLSLRLLERAEDRGRPERHGGDKDPGLHASVFASERLTNRDRLTANGCPVNARHADLET
jgi:hypothetical protein